MVEELRVDFGWAAILLVALLMLFALSFSLGRGAGKTAACRLTCEERGMHGYWNAEAGACRCAKLGEGFGDG